MPEWLETVAHVGGLIVVIDFCVTFIIKAYRHL